MRNGSSNNRRQRGRGNSSRQGNNQRMHVFDSNGPDVRIRGTAHQVNEKYMALAKDSAASGDRIMAESYLQHAEHYQRIINSWQEYVRRQPSQGQERTENTDSKEDSNDDLSLPVSILGVDSKAESATRTQEVLAE